MIVNAAHSTEGHGSGKINISTRCMAANDADGNELTREVAITTEDSGEGRYDEAILEATAEVAGELGGTFSVQKKEGGGGVLTFLMPLQTG